MRWVSQKWGLVPGEVAGMKTAWPSWWTLKIHSQVWVTYRCTTLCFCRSTIDTIQSHPDQLTTLSLTSLSKWSETGTGRISFGSLQTVEPPGKGQDISTPSPSFMQTNGKRFPIQGGCLWVVRVLSKLDKKLGKTYRGSKQSIDLLQAEILSQDA